MRPSGDPVIRAGSRVRGSLPLTKLSSAGGSTEARKVKLAVAKAARSTQTRAARVRDNPLALLAAEEPHP